MRILVVEDQRKAAAFLEKGLAEEGYAVDVAVAGERALEAARHVEYDLVVLDLMLPGMDGLSVCRRLRERGLSLPILMLTAKDTTDDTVEGLDSGADDYLTKPFEFAELLARIRALLRRPPQQGEACLRAGELLLDPARRVVSVAGERIDLTRTEFSLLEYLLKHADRTLTRTHLLVHVWQQSHDTYTNVVDVYVGRLRRKLGSGPGRPLILTEHGVGYRLVNERQGARR